MTLAESIALFGIMVALAAMPSTSVALVVTRSATAGISKGIAAAVGIVLGDLLFVTLAILGLSALAETMGSLFMVIKYLGAAYLLWLGISLLTTKGTDRFTTNESSGKGGLATSLFAGLFITLGDIKAIFFYASLFPMFIDLTALRTLDVLMIVLVTLTAVGGVKIVYALSATQIASLARGTRLARTTRKAAGGFMIGAGGYLIAKT